MKRAVAIEIISFLFILLFVYAAVSKLMDIQKFRIQLGQSPMLTGIASYVVWLIPGMEILIAVLFAWPSLRLIACYAAFSLMLMFTIYIVLILNFSEQIPCSCGGVLEKLNWTEHLIFNIGFIFLALSGILLHSNKVSNNSIKV